MTQQSHYWAYTRRKPLSLDFVYLQPFVVPFCILSELACVTNWTWQKCCIYYKRLWLPSWIALSGDSCPGASWLPCWEECLGAYEGSILWGAEASFQQSHEWPWKMIFLQWGLQKTAWLQTLERITLSQNNQAQPLMDSWSSEVVEILIVGFFKVAKFGGNWLCSNK